MPLGVTSLDPKYMVFLLGGVCCLPAAALAARRHPIFLAGAFIIMVFGTTQTESLFGLPTDINFASREWYRGTTRGVEISYLDFLAVIVLFGGIAMRRREGIGFFVPPSTWMLAAFLLWASMNVVVSEPQIFGVFELTKIARGMLILLAASAYVRSSREVRYFIWALAIAAMFEGAVALQDRYFDGLHRVSGTLPHPNSLSMFCLQIFPLLLSAWFAKDISARLRNATVVASVAAAIGVILSISRTGFAALILLTIATLAVNVGFRLSARNVGLIIVVALIGTGVLVKSWDTVFARFASFSLEQEYLTEQGDRGRYFRKGSPALEDNPIFGVGLNNWSYWVSNRYASQAGYESEPYPSTERPPARGGQEAPAHNLFLITAVELGVPGLLLLLALLGRWLYITGSGIVRISDCLVDRIRVGAFLSVCGVVIQSLTEWEFRQTSLFFLGHIVIGVAASIYYQTNWKPR